MLGNERIEYFSAIKRIIEDVRREIEKGKQPALSTIEGEMRKFPELIGELSYWVICNGDKCFADKIINLDISPLYKIKVEDVWMPLYRPQYIKPIVNKAIYAFESAVKAILDRPERFKKQSEEYQEKQIEPRFNFIKEQSSTNKEERKNIAVKEFKEFLQCPDIEKLMNALHPLLDKEKGKMVAIVIMALKKKGYLFISNGKYTQLYRAMSDVFGYIGTYQSINKYMDKEIIPESEIQDVVERLP
ncbi:hypothetical protein Barb4_00414 [Bacteroidales bacterium Barb4]|nr:hypothetical protein Barb4_00414 [Bacteroidales bacterium Barb4]